MNKKLEYGILGLLYLASESDKVASVREIAAQSNIPEALLSKVMQSMKNVGLVSSVHGNHGGYRLNRSLDKINLLELTQVLVGPVHVTECLEPGNESCRAKPSCTIIAPMSLLNQRIMSLFEETSLDTLAARKASL